MKIINGFIIACASIISVNALADPWFTGSLLAPSATTYLAGHLGYQGYVFYTDDLGHYNHRWKKESTLNTKTVNPLMLVTLGLSSRSDLQLSVPYLFNSERGASDNGFGDIALTLGYQVLKDIPGTWIPDLKVTIAEAFPTGKYNNLDPTINGTDSFGAGSFQTSLAATFQKLWHVGGDHYLRGRWGFTYTIPADVNLHGSNAYGGGSNTNGTIDLGNHFNTDLAFEYTLTQNWVPAIDFLFTSSGSNSFTGNPGTTSSGLPAPISTSSSEEWSIAPAMEYNFNADVGIIAGVWFTVAGRNAPDFVTGIISLVVNT